MFFRDTRIHHGPNRTKESENSVLFTVFIKNFTDSTILLFRGGLFTITCYDGIHYIRNNLVKIQNYLQVMLSTLLFEIMSMLKIGVTQD